MKELIANTQNQMNTLTSELNGERETNKLNDLKSEFRKHLSESGIKGVDQQNLVIGNHLSVLGSVEDFGALASKVATENPYLTESALKGGAGTIPAANIALAEKEITFGMPAEEEAAIRKARRESN